MSTQSNKSKYQQDLTRAKGFIEKLESKTNLDITELGFLGSFLVNFIVGKIIHFTAQSEEVNNYYNDKRNIFNRIFVKQGWFWTTIVMVIYYGILIYKNESSSANPKKFNSTKVIKTAIRNYLITTLWWILFTQWCFGLPLMDKVFVWTGGSCYVDHDKLTPNHKLFSMFSAHADQDLTKGLWSKSINSKTCRKLKGQWQGGHDPSGHVFLLTHSSIYLFFEMRQLGISYGLENLKGMINRLTASKTWKQKFGVLGTHILANPSLLVMALISLWWYMLLMTNIYFHSILEKLVGLLCGYCISVLYLLPRYDKTRNEETRHKKSNDRIHQD